MARDKKKVYQFSMVRQGNTKCCWLACYQMQYLWKGREMGEVNRRLVKAGIRTDDALDISQWSRASRILGMKGMSVSYLKNSYDNLADTLHRWGPMWCAGDFLDGAPHAVLIAGWNDKSKTVHFIDPYGLWKGDTGSNYSHSYWSKLVKSAEFACQQWA